MSGYLLGLATLPALLMAWLLIAALVQKSPSVRFYCACGQDWGNPSARGWTVWWKFIVRKAHMRTSRHRAWKAKR